MTKDVTPSPHYDTEKRAEIGQWFTTERSKSKLLTQRTPNEQALVEAHQREWIMGAPDTVVHSIKLDQDRLREKEASLIQDVDTVWTI